MNSFDQEIMARTALGEARGEGEGGMQAVMWAGMNRFTSKRWFAGQSIAGTFLLPEQFSCWLQKDPNYRLIANITQDIGIFSDALKWATSIISGVLPDPTLGATHYANLAECTPSWLQGAQQTVIIGHHTFFKNVK